MTVTAEYDEKGVFPVIAEKLYVEDVGGHRTIIHAPNRTEAEQAAYDARLDAAIRRACPGWRLAKTKAASVADSGRRPGEEARYGESGAG